jgi:DNA-binding transcriptional LysR family regulator
MIDLTRLQVFLSVAENLSFSEAAQRLHISQPMWNCSIAPVTE